MIHQADIQIEAQVVEITPEQMEELAAIRQGFLLSLGESFERQKDEAISWRSQYEPDWVEAERQYNEGFTPISEARESNVAIGNVAERYNHLRAVDNITRTKTKAISARAQNILFPTFDKNFDLEVSSVTKTKIKANVTNAALGMNQAGSREELKQIIDKMFTDALSAENERVDSLERSISDRLSSCNYQKHGSEAIFDGCLYGTGVIEGPFAKVITKERFDKETGVSITESMLTQAVERVDPWDFFPQPARCIAESEYAFRLHLMTKTQLLLLCGQESIGFDSEQIKKLTLKEPTLGKLSASPMYTRDNVDNTKVLKGRYPVWKYVGPVPKECFKYFGIEDESQTSETIHGEVWFSDGVVIRAAMSIIREAVKLPFYVWNFDRNPNSIFGYGVPYICKHDQRAANTAWSAALYNASMSAAPIFGVVKDMIEAEDGKQVDMTFTEPRTVLLKNTNDVRNAISHYVTPNTIAASLEIYDRAKANADEHTMLPAFTQGAPSAAVTTSSGMALMMNDSNIVQKQIVGAWDTNVTMELLPRMVRKELELSADSDCACDVDVIPKGASHLLVKDLRLQHNMTLLAMADNPNNSAYINRERILKTIISDIDQSPESVLNSKEETDRIMAQAQQSVSPDSVKFEIEKMKIDAQLLNDREQREFELMREKIRQQGSVFVAQLNNDSAMARAAADERVSVQEVAAKLQMKDRDAQVREFLESMKLQKKMEEVAIKSDDVRFGHGVNAELEAQKIADRARSRQEQIATETPVRIAQ